MILKNAFRRKGRTVMTIAAVAISTALLVSMLSIAEGILLNATMGIQESKRDIIITSEGTHGIINGHELANELKNDENISSASAILGTNFQEFLSLNISEYSPLEPNPSALGIGIVPDDEINFLNEESERKLQDVFEIKFYDWFEEGTDPHYKDNYTGEWTYEILIDDVFAQKNNLSKGSEITINNLPNKFKISGIFSTVFTGEGAFSFDFGFIFMHLSELQSLLNLTEDDVVTTISISLSEGSKDLTTARSIANDLKTRFPFYSISTKEDRLKSVEDQMALARVFYTAIGSVSLIIGLLFVACIMIMSVYERTNEFGMMRAIGISKKSIFIQTIFESMVFVIIGGIIGIIMGYYGSQAFGDFLKTSSGLEQEFTAFTSSLVIQTLLIIICFGTLISLYPAWQAARKKIQDALRFIR